MLTTANIALIISGAAFVASATSAAIAILTFRRSSARLKLRLYREINIGPGSTREFNILLRVTNARTSAVQLAILGFEMKNSSGTLSLGGEYRQGEQFPF